jgi:spore maturation protein A
MLNYIWAGLIIASLGFALYVDFGQAVRDPYRNGIPLPVTLRFQEGADPRAERNQVEVIIGPEVYRSHFGVNEQPETPLPATLIRSDAGVQLRFAREAPLPAPMSAMRQFQNPDQELRATVTGIHAANATASAQILFDRIRFLRLKAIQEGAIDSAKTAVTLAIGLIGVLALWLGMMKIAEASGLINIFVIIVQPVLRLLFPQIPRGHPALGMIALNLAANMLGLGNAATPLGIKAMEELQKLNSTDDTATDPMVMLLAVNTASVQLVPPATLVALMGIAAGQVFIPILIVTFTSLIVAVIVTRLLGMLPGYRRSNPAPVAPRA